MAPLRIAAIVLAAGLLLGPVGAADARADCRCLYSGRYYHAGEFACIRTPNGPRLARCDKVSNLSSWRFTAKNCGRPSAGLRPSLPALIADLHPSKD
jgi:hypothetical protein